MVLEARELCLGTSLGAACGAGALGLLLRGCGCGSFGFIARCRGGVNFLYLEAGTGGGLASLQSAQKHQTKSYS